MNIEEVMSREVRTIRMVDRLDAAARLMWENDCGIAPVVDGNQAVVGIVTDRDLCMASYTQGRALAEIPVTAVMARSVKTCRANEPVAAALGAMQQHQLHRLPVVDARGALVGMVSINDLLRAALARPAALDGTAVLKALAAIRAPRTPAKAPAAAAAARPATAAAAPTVVAAPVPIPAPAAAMLPAAAPAKPGKASGKDKGKGKGKKG